MAWTLTGQVNATKAVTMEMLTMEVDIASRRLR